MQLNNLKRTHKWKKQAPVGRGGKRGKTSGRGTKGQNARAGRKLRPEIRDVIMRLPKLRGRGTNTFVSRFTKPIVVKIGKINDTFTAGDNVNINALIEKKIVGAKAVGGRVKIIGGGKVDKALKIVGIRTSSSVKTLIEKVGGSVEVVS